MSVLDQLADGLIVSCQAYGDEPMNRPEIMAAVAQSAVRGGACAIRAEGITDLVAVRDVVETGLIGLVKVGSDGVFITPTLDHALAVAATGCEIVALDGTRRTRPDGRTLAETITGLRRSWPEIVVMADCGSTADAIAAVEAGADVLGTTLAGYTDERPLTDGPDLAVLAEICAQVEVPVIAEGRYARPEHLRAARRAGAFAVCVGSAVTHPERITQALLRDASNGDC